MINNLDITKRYGILLSGGLDSAILLYLLIQQYPKLDIQPFTIPKFDGAIIYADPIITYINEKLNSKLPKTIQVGNPTLPHRNQSKSAVLDIFSKHSVDFLFIGINQNPPELETYPGAPERDTNSPNEKILLPFANMFKDEILKLYFDNDQEELIELTHSCTEQEIGRCGRCWQCTERAWAFSQHGREDTGLK